MTLHEKIGNAVHHLEMKHNALQLGPIKHLVCFVGDPSEDLLHDISEVVGLFHEARNKARKACLLQEVHLDVDIMQNPDLGQEKIILYSNAYPGKKLKMSDYAKMGLVVQVEKDPVIRVFNG